MNRLRNPAAWAGLGLAAGVGLAIRVNNAFRYKTDLGFDALENWKYIDRLTQSWTLPPPDAGWSTAHPPLFYYVSAAVVRGLGDPEKDAAVVVLRLLSAGVGLGAVALCASLVRRADRDTPWRAALAATLLLFLPVHIYMSAMLSEELLVSSLTTLVAVGICWHRVGGPTPGADSGRSWTGAAALGLAAGLALLTKLTGLLTIAAGVGAYALAWRRRDDSRHVFTRVAVFAGVASIAGGWYYARNWIEYGYLYPHGLETHQIMFSMPPGERELADYFRLPFATLTDPRVTAPDLLRSVWGSTYVSVWFDGHRHFLHVTSPLIRGIGSLLCTLAILPTAAFLVGLVRGLRRAIRDPGGIDLPLILLTGLTLVGYVIFSWRNPWFAVLKGSFLLGLSAPFAFYTSEVLVDWARRSRGRMAIVAVTLCTLFALSGLVFTQGLVFSKSDSIGVRWEGDPRPKKTPRRRAPGAAEIPREPSAGREDVIPAGSLKNVPEGPAVVADHLARSSGDGSDSIRRSNPGEIRSRNRSRGSPRFRSDPSGATSRPVRFDPPPTGATVRWA